MVPVVVPRITFTSDKVTFPVKEVAAILVTVKVSVAKVISASSTSIPAVPAKVTLPAVSPESVMLPPTKVV